MDHGQQRRKPVQPGGLGPKEILQTAPLSSGMSADGSRKKSPCYGQLANDFLPICISIQLSSKLFHEPKSGARHSVRAAAGPSTNGAQKTVADFHEPGWPARSVARENGAPPSLARGAADPPMRCVHGPNACAEQMAALHEAIVAIVIGVSRCDGLPPSRALSSRLFRALHPY